MTEGSMQTQKLRDDIWGETRRNEIEEDHVRPDY